MDIFGSYSGADFLLFYVGMLVTCVFAGLWIPAVLRPAGRYNRVADLEEIAVLAGGSKRHASATLSSLFAKDALERAGTHKLRVVRQSVAETSAERAVLGKVADFTLGEARKTLRDHAGAIEERLVRGGLLMESGDRTRLRLLSITPYAALFVMGLYRQQAGDALGEPTGFLIGLLIVTIIFALVRLVKFNPRTKEGNAALKALEEQSSRMRRAPTTTEAGFAVALFGTAVLVGTPWEPLHAVQRAGGPGGDGGGGDGSDGGGCGGGCGGCGG
ncbi:MAG: TIGR04222 domain-containing membrane protein [Erythrobacter sp.]